MSDQEEPVKLRNTKNNDDDTKLNQESSKKQWGKYAAVSNRARYRDTMGRPLQKQQSQESKTTDDNPKDFMNLISFRSPLLDEAGTVNLKDLEEKLNISITLDKNEIKCISEEGKMKTSNLDTMLEEDETAEQGLFVLEFIIIIIL